MTASRFRNVTAERVAGIAPAKLNLFLEVLGKRPDGYHELRTVFHEVDLADEIEVALAPDARGDSAECTGHALDVPPEENLVLKAVRAFRDRLPSLPPIRVRLNKQVPPGSGMGGGSSDAAFVLRALEQLTHAPRAPQELALLARDLGADVAFFLLGGTAMGTARGEELTAIKGFPPSNFVVVLADFSLRTATVYAHTDLTAARMEIQAFVEGMRRLPRGQALVGCFNRLEAAARRVEPRLGALLEGLRSETKAPWTMTGSGSALYASAATLEEATRLAQAVRTIVPRDIRDVRVVRSFIGDPGPVAG